MMIPIAGPDVATVEIAGELYERRPCYCGDGTATDSTNADSVASGGQTTVRCSHCSGRGETFHSLRVAALAATATPVIAPEPVGDMPDWMLG